MAAFAAIYRDRAGIADLYFKTIEEAHENSGKEYWAALTIQCAWRGNVRRRFRKERNEKALIIQKVFRRRQARRLLQCLLVEKSRTDRMAYFNEMARKIQKVWRGYDSRRHVFDAAKQRRYLQDVAAANQQMKHELDEHYTRTSEFERRERFQYEKRRQEDIALRQHHLVSTAAIPSIFQPPAFTRDAASMPAIEHFIKSVNRAKIVIPVLGKQGNC